MIEQTFQRRLLALHYVFPVPLPKVIPLLKIDPDLSQLENIQPSLLAKLCNIPIERAIHLKNMYKELVYHPLLETYENHNILPIAYNDNYYPESLLKLYDPPVILYTKGDVSLLANIKKIAIIGSRKATSYSEKSIEKILPPLIQQNYVIVSGLARGADTLAHRKTIEMGGKTIGVLGTGFSNIYPKENEDLANFMSKSHLLVTEYPPYITPKKWNFPMRNRIISGLSLGVVITEAHKKSGTVSTMEHALENGKEIFAVPGSIHSDLSEGPHHLILEGAKPIWDGHQILEEMR
ncbi:DNA-processing protein DprA [Psychrobacillus sp. BL-248-WT-3]|uniref:DNA-processing protein DprA n=1 Tax=Psychrobacillus sp. BL-248-WT-3 TaxID=2725306 RepID=UPI00146D7F57|nr:DNA-processing protein DprA [Psychrobacillus sp. BL-248-WT-3]NME04824.1 DNA-protecting protein DprA [Psychrobacillus sp. BL-248-WT-3]